jgi:uncharacterized protein with gpF-like domain
MINLRTQRAQRQEVATQNKVRNALEKLLQKQSREALDIMGRRAVEAYTKGGETAALASTIESEALVEKVLKTSYARCISVGAARLQSVAMRKSSGLILERKVDDDGELLTDEELGAIIKSYARANAAAKAKYIGETTRTRIKRAVAEGIDEDYGPAKIAKLIEEKTYGVINGDRAELIARTETHGAMNYGSLESAKMMDGIATKTWISASDSRTREDHSEMDGQTVGIEDEFEGPCAGMSFPGDSSGPAEQVINCRCGLIYNT